MNALIVYDSVYGNTERVAQAIGRALPGVVRVLRVEQACAQDLESADLLIVGSPTHGGFPTSAMQELMEQLPLPAHDAAKAAAFDTRFGWKIAKNWGFAAPKMAETLQAKGWTLAAPPEGFIVRGLKKGPLKKGEQQRAEAWAGTLTGSST